MTNGFVTETKKAAESGDIPSRVSNKMLWALAVDAIDDRKRIKIRINKLELRAAAVGGAAGLIAAIAALIAAL